MKIAENTMKVIGAFLIAGLAGCSDDAGPDASYCSLEARDCQDWWPQRTSDAGVTPKSISYNALGADALMFNAVLRNPTANFSMTQHSLTSLLQKDPLPNSDAEYFQLQLQDPFARHIMGYLVGCALPDTPEPEEIHWINPRTDEKVTWYGDLGLCPAWKDGTMDAACQELLSACLLARNNAFGREVLISVRGGRQDDNRNIAALALEREAPGGEPCDLGSFAYDCSPGASWDLSSNCLGPTGSPYPGRWHSQHIGTCTAGTQVKLNVNLASNCTNNLLIRICSSIYGCDSQRALASAQIPCGATDSTIEFTCKEEGAFTLMYANADPMMPAGDFNASVMTPAATGPVARYPVPEEEAFPWQEGAFYGNLFCQKSTCFDARERPVVDTSLQVEVQDASVVYLWSGGGEVVMDDAGFESGPEHQLLIQRGEAHQRFVSNHPDLANPNDPNALLANRTVYQQMYACISPNWDPDEAYAKRRVCAGISNDPSANDPTYCAAHSTGRCWGDLLSCSDGSIMVTDTASQCSVKDVTDVTDGGPSVTFPLGDRDYGDCMSSDDTWSHPLTVFLNDPCDIVPETVYPSPPDPREVASGEVPGEVACGTVPICRQTTLPTPL